MAHDLLSDVLRTLRLRSALFYRVACHGRWAAAAPGAAELAGSVMPGADHVVEYHVVTRGDCWAAVQGEPPLRLHTGDIIVLPQGDAHVLSSAPGARAEPDPTLPALDPGQRPFHVMVDGIAQSVVDAARACALPSGTELVCGFIGCDLPPFDPLLASLPRMLHLPATASGSWSQAFIELAAREAGEPRPGSDALLERLSEMMFIDAIRQHLQGLPEDSTGWLAALRDRFVARALSLLHADPARSWSVDELGSQVGLSRSALHERFVQLLGQPPMQYLARWRMQLAASLLLDSQASVMAVGLRVGYESEAAFSRAFRRWVGASPAAWRKHRKAA